MEEQTFEEYTKQRVEDCEIINTYIPGLFYNPECYLDALCLIDHMNDVKQALEKLFRRKLHWKDVDLHSVTLMHYVKRFVNKPTCKEDIIFWQVDVRKKFCEFIGCPFPEDKINDYFNMIINSNKHTEETVKNIKGEE
jgi:hypothetical protein